MGSRQKRILIYRVGSLGDTVVALPSLHLVARAFPGADRRLLTNVPVAAKAPPAAAVLEGTGLVAGYFQYAVGVRSVRRLLRLWWELVCWGPETLVYLAPARGIAVAKRDAWFFRLCGIRRLLGMPLTGELQRNLIGADGTLEPEAERLARNLSELGDARLDEPASWDLHLTQAERQRAEKVLEAAHGRFLIAVSIGTKVQTNDWGQKNWVQLIGCLALRHPGYALVLTGAIEDAEYSEAIAEAWRAASGIALNLCGLLRPRESAAIFAKAALYLGHDSGPLHMAAAAGTPCVAIFSARGLPRVWFPHGKRHAVIYHQVDCAGCGLEVCIEQRKKCLTSVTVDEVLSAVRGVLDTTGVSTAFTAPMR